MSSKRDKLTEIAHDKSAGARSKLLALLSELVFEQRRPTEVEINALCSVAKLLLRVADDESRTTFAVTIAPNEFVPRDIVFLLLDDKIYIAGPILRYSPVLTETDLLKFAETLGDDRLVFVAQRSGLGSNVVDVLVSRGGDIVQIAVTENSSVKLTGKSLQKLLNNAEASDALCRSLVSRPEISKSDAERLIQLISKSLKGRVKSTGAVSTPASKPVVAVSPPAPPKPTPAKAGVSEMLAAIRSGKVFASDAISRLADEDRFNELTSLISGLSRVDDVSIMRLIVRADADGIGMILKALEISDEAFASVISLRKRRLKMSDAQARFERDDYAKLAVAQSKATLAQLTQSRGR